MITDSTQSYHKIISMGEFFLGTNWYGVEESNGSYFRWTGPELVSTIEIATPRHIPYRMNLTLYSAASEEILAGLQIKVDGMAVETIVGSKRNPAYVTAVIAPAHSPLEHAHTLLSLCLPDTLLADNINPGSDDPRKLGIAVSQVKLFPLSRPYFAAQRTQGSFLFDGISYLRQHQDVLEAVVGNRYSSAFDFFNQNNCLDAATASEISPEFDERPGDLYDIFQWQTDRKLADIENYFSSEINKLRNIVLRQNDIINDLFKKYKKLSS